MKFTVSGQIFTPNSVVSELSIDGKHECYILEPTWRGNDNANHVEFKTAISETAYKIIVDWSPRFNRMMPHIMALSDYQFGPIMFNAAGVRLHWGNFPKDSEACLLCGTTEGADFVGHSVDEFTPLFNKIMQQLNTGSIDLEVIRNHEPYLPSA